MKPRCRSYYELAVMYGRGARLAAAVFCLSAGQTCYGELLYRTIEHEGKTREYSIYVPSSYDASTAAPLVFNIHAATQDYDVQATVSNLNEVAEREGFLVVYPNAVTRDFFRGEDNIGFVDRLLEIAESEYEVDPNRVYSTGFSQGAMMSYALSVLRPHKFAAIATVAGVPAGGSPFPDGHLPVPGRPLPLLSIHGTGDFVVPYQGGLGNFGPAVFASVEDYVEKWISNNGGAAPIAFESLPDVEPGDSTTVDRYSCEDCGSYVGVSGETLPAEVIHYRVNGGGHNWPGDSDQWGGPQLPVNYDFSGSETIWEFFQGHELAETPVPPSFELVANTHTIIDKTVDGAGDDTALLQFGGLVGDRRGDQRLIAKFDLPPIENLESAVLRVFLHSVRDSHSSPLSVFHSLTDNDLDQDVSDYENASYSATELSLIEPGASDEAFYEVDVTELVLADYASDDDPMSAFRLQVDASIEGGYLLDNRADYVRNPTLVLTARAPTFAADFNGDGTVDLLDFDVLKGGFGATSASRSDGDANGDGVVDLFDFNILKGEFGSAHAAPEPATWLVAAVGVLSQVLAARRRSHRNALFRIHAT